MSEGCVSCCTLGLRHRVISRYSYLFLEARCLPCSQVDAPGGHISVGYRVADTFVLEEDQLRVREPYSACAHKEVYRKDVPGIHKTTGRMTLRK